MPVFAENRFRRNEVVGEDYVERSLAASDDFNMPLQEYITKYAWGDV